MNILYISCHEVLEYDELKLLSQIPNVKIRSIGAYADPTTPKPMRPAIPEMEYSRDHMDWINAYEPEHVLNRNFLGWADVIIYMHAPEHIMKSKEVLDNYTGKIIYRSIGQSSDSVEILLANFKSAWGDRFKIVRYSPNERFHLNYAGSDALIRFYKDSNEYKGWYGAHQNVPSTVLMALQAAPERGTFGKFENLADYTEGLNRVLIGPRNEGYAHRMRVFYPNYEEYKRFLQSCTVLCYGGMIPASYTLTFIEAMLTGMPIVALDKNLWVGEHRVWCPPDVYEVEELIDSECVVHSWESLRPTLDELMTDRVALERISHTNRLNAEMLFDKRKIEKQWRTLLGL